MKAVILSIALLASYRVAAAELSHTEVKVTGLDSSSSAANILSDTDLARARIWELSKMEWHRYLVFGHHRMGRYGALVAG